MNIKEVARQAKVSAGTVSNVLNKPEVVAPATRKRVLDAIAALGYVRNESARMLRAGSSRTIALVVLDIANPFFTDVARGAEGVAEAGGSQLLLCNSGQNQRREDRHLDLLEQQRVQGVLITPVDDSHNTRLDELVARGTPVVLVDRGSKRRDRCSVAVDDMLGGRLAGLHLAERGHRRVAFAGGPVSIRQVLERHDGAAKALAESGAELLLFETDSTSVADGRKAAAAIAELPATRRPTAVFCANDLVALGVLQEMTRRGVRVPQDLAIVGYDDIEFAEAAAIPLTSVRQPREQLGRTATELLLDEVASGERHKHRHIVFEPELVVRASSNHRRRTRAVT
ncbi:MAG: LacI family DNA-binding transcriptional regulator [Mycobacteriales bacterium]